jgi:hypothetical protein
MQLAALVLLMPGMLASQMGTDNLPDPGNFFPVPPPFVWGSGGHTPPAQPKAAAPVVPATPPVQQDTQRAQAPQTKQPADPAIRHRRPSKCTKQRTSVPLPVQKNAGLHFPLIKS